MAERFDLANEIRKHGFMFGSGHKAEVERGTLCHLASVAAAVCDGRVEGLVAERAGLFRERAITFCFRGPR